MEKSITKVGILTFHYAHNYGAMLQAYALKTYLAQLGYTVHIINYHNSKVESVYKESFPAWKLVGRRALVFPWRWWETAKKLRQARRYREAWISRREKFKQFEQEYLLDGMTAPVTAAGLAHLELDAILFGSDQIWNTEITGEEDTAYWGQFPAEGTKKIAYGASVLTNELTPGEQKNVTAFIDSFDAVSVREQTLSRQITELTGCRAQVVVDPTLLLSKEAYMRFIRPNPPEPKPYVLLYLMKEGEEAAKAAKKINLPARVIGCRGNELVCDIGMEKILDAGPMEFLNWVYHAEYIITNSFHGTVFSILLQRPFCVVCDADARIDNLLSMAGMERARIPDAAAFSPECFVRSGADNLQKLQDGIDSSRRYLTDALSG